MRINKKISALLCYVAMCCSNGQVSKTSASLLGYFFSVAAVQQWIRAASNYYARFRAKGCPIYYRSWFLPFCVPSGEVDNKGFSRVAESLSCLESLPLPILFTYLARKELEFGKEKENNKKVSGEKTCVDSKNDKGKKDSNNKK